MAQLCHIAQANIARMVAPIDDPIMAGFVAQLADMNALAERSSGFVWRLQTEDGDATAIRAFDDDRILFNMSVWETIDALFDYTYRSAHAGPLKDRKQWFAPLPGPSLVLWWVAAGTTPTVDDAKRRLEMLDRNGPSADAFTFRERFEAPGDGELGM